MKTIDQLKEKRNSLVNELRNSKTLNEKKESGIFDKINEIDKKIKRLKALEQIDQHNIKVIELDNKIKEVSELLQLINLGKDIKNDGRLTLNALKKVGEKYKYFNFKFSEYCNTYEECNGIVIYDRINKVSVNNIDELTMLNKYVDLIDIEQAFINIQKIVEEGEKLKAYIEEYNEKIEALGVNTYQYHNPLMYGSDERVKSYSF